MRQCWISIVFFCLFLFFRGHPKITLRIKTRVFACKLCAFFILAIFGFPLKYPFPRGIFCSAPPLGCGSVHVLDGSFARFCVSENARVPLRYSGQPLHRKIIASRSPNTPRFCLSNRFFANFNRAIDYKSIYTDSWGPENNASNQNARVFHTRCFRFSPRGGSRVGGSCFVLLIAASV